MPDQRGSYQRPDRRSAVPAWEEPARRPETSATIVSSAEWVVNSCVAVLVKQVRPDSVSRNAGRRSGSIAVSPAIPQPASSVWVRPLAGSDALKPVHNRPPPCEVCDGRHRRARRSEISATRHRWQRAPGGISAIPRTGHPLVEGPRRSLRSGFEQGATGHRNRNGLKFGAAFHRLPHDSVEPSSS